ncbi:MAG: 4-hydroxy-tetrahydrodipicolinate synthase [Ignavibacteria bacterium]|nr:4-hydroxy-tetrahydrodipicolinate synthase [Ignavibacteria bacterium]
MFKKLTGVGTALITPFKKDFSLDEIAFRNLVKRQIENGTNYLVPLGTTGETPCLEKNEKLKILEISLDESLNKIPVIAGVGSNNTKQVVENIKEFEKFNLEGYLVVTPYYNKPTQEGLYQHFKIISENTDKQIILYNVPSRTSINMTAETTLRLAEIKNVTAIKEASSNQSQISQIIKYAPDNFSVISGNDDETLSIMMMGGIGVVSVASNVAPKEMSEFCKLINPDIHSAAKEHHRLFNLFKNCFVESNPIPAKAAMYSLGLIENVLRLPLTTSTNSTFEIMKNTLNELNINY